MQRHDDGFLVSPDGEYVGKLNFVHHHGTNHLMAANDSQSKLVPLDNKFANLPKHSAVFDKISHIIRLGVT